MFERLLNLFHRVPADAPCAAPRSPQWDEVRDEHVRRNPTCAACGEGESLQVHHVEPFGVNPMRELDPDNLLTLCMHPSRQCHYIFGHAAAGWNRFNRHVRDDAATFLRHRQEAKRG